LATRPKEPAALEKETLGARAPPLTGWLLKRKRGRIFGGTNRRFFTIDFAAQIFYYSNSEKPTKQVSRPMSFRDIVGLEPLTAKGELASDAPIVPCCDDGEMMEAADDTTDDSEVEEAAPRQKAKRSDDQASVTSKGTTSSSWSSRLRLPSFAKRKTGEKFGFALMMRGGSGERMMELLAPSKEDSDRWMAAFNSAILLVVAKPVVKPAAVVEKPVASGGYNAAGSAPLAELSTDDDGSPCATTTEAESYAAAMAAANPDGVPVDANGFPDSSDDDSD
jgi:hypothetical protein